LPKSNKKIIERGYIDNPNMKLLDHSLSVHGTDI
jgi:hypothetical protein